MKPTESLLLQYLHDLIQHPGLLLVIYTKFQMKGLLNFVFLDSIDRIDIFNLIFGYLISLHFS